MRWIDVVEEDFKMNPQKYENNKKQVVIKKYNVEVKNFLRHKYQKKKKNKEYNEQLKYYHTHELLRSYVQATFILFLI